MKVYKGWVLSIEGAEYTVKGSMKLRGVQAYVLAGKTGVRSIKRDDFLAGMHNGSIKYVASVAA